MLWMDRVYLQTAAIGQSAELLEDGDRVLGESRFYPVRTSMKSSSFSIIWTHTALSLITPIPKPCGSEIGQK